MSSPQCGSAGRLRGVAGFRTARRQVAAGRRTVLTLTDLAQDGPKAAADAAPQAGGPAALTILARDAAGNQRRVTCRIVVPRR